MIHTRCIPTTISVKQIGLEKILTNASIAQDREPLVTWLSGVVEDCIEVGVVCETESGNTLC